jgi:hypothetical protein
LASVRFSNSALNFSISPSCQFNSCLFLLSSAGAVFGAGAHLLPVSAFDAFCEAVSTKY